MLVEYRKAQNALGIFAQLKFNDDRKLITTADINSMGLTFSTDQEVDPGWREGGPTCN